VEKRLALSAVEPCFDPIIEENSQQEAAQELSTVNRDPKAYHQYRIGQRERVP
jgi:hypothetical protein